MAYIISKPNFNMEHKASIEKFFTEYIDSIMDDYDMGIRLADKKQTIENYLTMKFKVMIQTTQESSLDLNNPIVARAFQNEANYVTGRSKKREKIRHRVRDSLKTKYPKKS
ncbi:MAG: hypothetical protein CBB97_24790 [Candidatus Endolissoclinum sp. TMED37]|nr:MAG: hypothetical protein CBB97_24790 [Candidatus Endolissoclinum sp. TMED37]|tara:strand:+ start:466 stop:798 length:333 start_codon:yes stop_codon:yes gene_type:complete